MFQLFDKYKKSTSEAKKSKISTVYVVKLINFRNHSIIRKKSHSNPERSFELYLFRK